MGSPTTTGEPRRKLTEQEQADVQRRLPEVVRAAIQGRISPEIMQALADGRRVEIAPLRELRDLLDQPGATVTTGMVKQVLNGMGIEKFLDQYDGLTLAEHTALDHFFREDVVFWRSGESVAQGRLVEDTSRWDKDPVVQCDVWEQLIHKRHVQLHKPSDKFIAHVRSNALPDSPQRRRCGGEMNLIVPALHQFISGVNFTSIGYGAGPENLLPQAFDDLLCALRQSLGNRFNAPAKLFGVGGEFRFSPKVVAMYEYLSNKRPNASYYSLNVQTGTLRPGIASYRSRFRMPPNEVPMDPFIGLILALVCPERFAEGVELNVDLPGAYYTPPPGSGLNEGVLRLRGYNGKIDLNIASAGVPYMYAGSGSVLFPPDEPVIK